MNYARPKLVWRTMTMISFHENRSVLQEQFKALMFGLSVKFLDHVILKWLYVASSNVLTKVREYQNFIMKFVSYYLTLHPLKCASGDSAHASNARISSSFDKSIKHLITLTLIIIISKWSSAPNNAFIVCLS